MGIKPFKRTELYNRLLEEHRAIVAKIKLPPKVGLKSMELLRKAVKLRVASGRKPKSVAAVLEGASMKKVKIIRRLKRYEKSK